MPNGYYIDQKLRMEAFPGNEKMASWSTKNFHLGAVANRDASLYKFANPTTFSGGYSGYKPLWRPPDNPLDGAKANRMFDADHGGASRPGYMGHRPGEKADPYVLASTTRRFKTPSWMVDTKPASMAQRISARRLQRYNSKPNKDFWSEIKVRV